MLMVSGDGFWIGWLMVCVLGWVLEGLGPWASGVFCCVFCLWVA